MFPTTKYLSKVLPWLQDFLHIHELSNMLLNATLLPSSSMITKGHLLLKYTTVSMIAI